MKKLILSLVAFLTLGLTTAKAETIFDANFAELASGAYGDTGTGNTQPATFAASYQVIMAFNADPSITYTTNGMRWVRDLNVGIMGYRSSLADYAGLSFVCNNVAIPNGEKINQIQITAFNRQSNCTQESVSGHIELYKTVSEDKRTFSEKVGENIDFEITGLVYSTSQTTSTAVISIPDEYVQAGLYYKIYIESVSGGCQNNWLGITDIQYNHAEQGITAAPVFEPNGGIFVGSVSVSLSSETEDANIYYTTDGTDPSAENGTHYTAAFDITENTTVKAIAYGDGIPASEVVSATFNIQVAAPVFTPADGEVENGQLVEIACPTNGATIYYTTNGNDPEVGTNPYTSPIPITEATTLKAIAVKENMVNSAITSADFTLYSSTAANFNFASKAWLTNNGIEIPAPNTNNTAIIGKSYMDRTGAVVLEIPMLASGYDNECSIKGLSTGETQLNVPAYSEFVIKSAENYRLVDVQFNVPESFNSMIYYKDNSGNQNYVSNNKWVAPEPAEATDDDPGVPDTTEVTFSAIMAAAQFNSIIVTFAVSSNVDDEIAAPEFSEEAGVIEIGTEISMTTETPGANIYYTTDGSEPSASSTLYTNPIAIYYTQTINAVAIMGDLVSEIATAEYVVTVTAAPEFSIESESVVDEGTIVYLTSKTPGAQIFYTLNGETPNTDGTGNTINYDDEGILLDEDVTIKAIALASGLTESSIATANYTVTPSEIQPSNGTALFDFSNASWVAKHEADENGQYTNSQFESADKAIALDFEKTMYWYEGEEVEVKDNALYLPGCMKFTFRVGTGVESITEITLNLNEEYGFFDYWTVEHGTLTGNHWTSAEPASARAKVKSQDGNITSVYLSNDMPEAASIKSIEVKYVGVPTSVDEIEAENDAEAVYYNLQGVRVANPEKGIYIVVKGNKVTKQVF